jgi:hypothetical protein
MAEEVAAAGWGGDLAELVEPSRSISIDEALNVS